MTTKDPLPFCVCEVPNQCGPEGSYKCGYCHTCLRDLPPQGENGCCEKCHGLYHHEHNKSCHKESSVKEEPCDCDACKRGMKTGHRVVQRMLKETPVEGGWVADFDAEFNGLFWSTGDAIKDFIRNVAEREYNRGVYDGNRKQV